MTAFYNEIDPFAAAWLRELIKAGHIADGVVDERSIEDIKPKDIDGFSQCHFFAGIGVWSYALRNAGWPDDRPVWTGSCPCQPFSAAGQGAGFDDERHLWPHFHWLIKECAPATVIGEQVASKGADPWIDLVQTDLEALGFAFGAVAFPSAGVGAPHIRDRTYWVAHADNSGRIGRGSSQASHGRDAARLEPERLCDAGRLEHARPDHAAAQISAACAGQSQADRPANLTGGPGIPSGRVADASCTGLRSERRDRVESEGRAQGGSTGGLADDIVQQRPHGQSRICAVDDAHGRIEGATASAGLRSDSHAGPTNGLWRDADWLLCRDGKWRPVEPGTFPLVNGSPARVGRLRGFGNAINAHQAQIFIEATGLIA